MLDFALSLAMLSALVLLGGAVWMYRKHGPNRQSVLMVIMALVLVGNVVIWNIPVAGGPAVEGVTAEP